MSRAFVKDGAESEVTLPDRPISPHRNLVTRRGLEQIRAAVARYQADLASASAEADRTAAAKASRELRYWSARLATAELAEPDPASERVVFGAAVTVLADDGEEQTWRIVGEDEADPAQHRIAWPSPVARALLGAEPGDLRALPTREVDPNVASPTGDRRHDRRTARPCTLLHGTPPRVRRVHSLRRPRSTPLAALSRSLRCNLGVEVLDVDPTPEAPDTK